MHLSGQSKGQLCPIEVLVHGIAWSIESKRVPKELTDLLREQSLLSWLSLQQAKLEGRRLLSLTPGHVSKMVN